jgi:formylglycine-generating enzyme required for sulfatase activity
MLKIGIIASVLLMIAICCCCGSELSTYSERGSSYTATSSLSLQIDNTGINDTLEATKTLQPITTLEPTSTLELVKTVGATVQPTKPNEESTGSQFILKDGMVLIFIPAGEFIMGSTDSDTNANYDEKPQHKIYLDAFWIDKTEVTNAMYKLCVDDAICQLPRDAKYYNDPAYTDHPIVNVDWHQVKIYCQWAGRRLPTEAEWEKAARGTDGRIYPWGNTLPTGNLLNLCDKNCPYDWKDDSIDDGFSETASESTYPAGASPYGVLDMAGNVWEWVSDQYDPLYYNNSPYKNPLGPSNESNYALRGGSWGDGGDNVRCANRHGANPLDYVEYRGFRCAISP